MNLPKFFFRWHTAVVVVVLAWCGFAVLKQHSVRAFNCSELSFHYRVWLEAGRPEGDQLTRFQEAHKSFVAATNLTVDVGGTTYLALFMYGEPAVFGAETLLMTTNGVIILLPHWGRPSIIHLH
jgi:hypothetical protein